MKENTNKKDLNVRISGAAHRRLKLAATKRGITIKALISELARTV